MIFQREHSLLHNLSSIWSFKVSNCWKQFNTSYFIIKCYMVYGNSEIFRKYKSYKVSKYHKIMNNGSENWM